MNLSTLKPAPGSVRNNKRIGRGQGSGRGGTSTRGHNGAQSRSGYSSKAGFEGGQMPLYRRVPKFGFKNPNRVELKPINLYALAELASKGVVEINPESLAENGLVSKNENFKILAEGELTTKVTVKAHAFSKKAIEIIEKAGGSVETI